MATRKNNRTNRATKGESKSRSKSARRHAPTPRGERRGAAEKPMSMATVAQKTANQAQRVIDRAEQESRRIFEEAARQSSEATARMTPWWTGSWEMLDPMGMARKWMDMTVRMWDSATETAFRTAHMMNKAMAQTGERAVS